MVIVQFNYSFYFKIEIQVFFYISENRHAIDDIYTILLDWRFAKERPRVIPGGKSAQNCFGGEAKGLSKGRRGLHFLIFSTRPPALFPEHVGTEF